jgi:hypothetical protein
VKTFVIDPSSISMLSPWSASAVPSHPTASHGEVPSAARSGGNFGRDSGDTVKGVHSRGGANVHSLGGRTRSAGLVARSGRGGEAVLTERQAPLR